MQFPYARLDAYRLASSFVVTVDAIAARCRVGAPTSLTS